jgi:hypothetical protein
MELSTEQIFGIIISILVIVLFMYWLISKIKTKPITFSFIERDKKKASEFTQGVIDDVDKVLSELSISARKNKSIQFHIQEGQSIHYADINLVINSDNWFNAVLKCQGKELIIGSKETDIQEKIKNFFVSTINQEVKINKVA